ncbi:MAG: hypothetical protein ACXADA_01335 [Candidatus Hodarchaeales archaeon]
MKRVILPLVVESEYKIFKSLLALVSRGDHQGKKYAIKRNKANELVRLVVIVENGTLVHLHRYLVNKGYRAWKKNPCLGNGFKYLQSVSNGRKVGS